MPPLRGAARQGNRRAEEDLHPALDLHHRPQGPPEARALRRQSAGACRGSARPPPEARRQVEIAQDTVVALTYELHDTDGGLIEKTDAPVEYLHGGYDGIFALVERALTGKSAGDTCLVRLEPDDAFGDYDAGLVQMQPLDKFPENVAVGMQFEGQSAETGKTMVYTVTDIADGKVM